MSTISGTAQRAQRSKTANPAESEAFRRIQHEITRMEVIVRQLLDFSHSRKLQYRELSPGRIAQSAASAITEEADNHQVRVRLCGPPESPPFSADPIRIEQALVNLLRNAIQTGSSHTVQLDWSIENDIITFAVEDDGPGIPATIRPRLFEPFFTTKAVGQGTGLGLAVVHGIIREHGGSVRVGESNLGGARIEISFPAKPSKSRKIQS